MKFQMFCITIVFILFVCSCIPFAQSTEDSLKSFEGDVTSQKIYSLAEGEWIGADECYFDIFIDPRRFGYLAIIYREDGIKNVIVNGRIIQDVEFVYKSPYSSSYPALRYVKGDAEYILIDGKEMGPYEKMESPSVHDIRVNEEGDLWGFNYVENGKYYIALSNGRPIGPFDRKPFFTVGKNYILHKLENGLYYINDKKVATELLVYSKNQLAYTVKKPKGEYLVFPEGGEEGPFHSIKKIALDSHPDSWAVVEGTKRGSLVFKNSKGTALELPGKPVKRLKQVGENLWSILFQDSNQCSLMLTDGRNSDRFRGKNQDSMQMRMADG